MDAEGYRPEDVEPELLCPMPGDFAGECPGLAQFDVLKLMGATVISDDSPRIMMLDGGSSPKARSTGRSGLPSQDDELEAAGRPAVGARRDDATPGP